MSRVATYVEKMNMYIAHKLVRKQSRFNPRQRIMR